MNRDKDQFVIIASSDLDYEKMVINIDFGNDQVAVLHCDKGSEQVEIKLLDSDQGKVIWTFDFKNFINALIKAEEALKRVNED